MRPVVLFCLIALASSRVPAQAPVGTDVPALERDCATLVSRVHAPTKMEVVVPLVSLPATIKALKPVRVTVAEEGLYVSTQRSAGRERGYFHLSSDTSAWREWAHSSGFVLVEAQLYSYERKLP